MKKRNLFFAAVITLALAGAAALLYRVASESAPVHRVEEFPVSVTGPHRIDTDLWTVPKTAVGTESGSGARYVLRVEHLRTKKVPVAVMGEKDGKTAVKSDTLATGDILAQDAGAVSDGQAVSIRTGLDDQQLVRLTVEAGFAAAENGNLDESMRFVSPAYRDDWGFDARLWAKFLNRAYREFKSPRITLQEPAVIRIDGSKAMVRAEINVEATYRGGRNYLLGGQGSPNEIFISMEKLSAGWKVVGIKGLHPLGFDEPFMRLLGAEVGMKLSPEEKRRKEEACMPCRREMADRFGPMQNK